MAFPRQTVLLKKKTTMSSGSREGQSKNTREPPPAGSFQNLGTPGIGSLLKTGETAVPVLRIWNLGHSAASLPRLEAKQDLSLGSQNEREGTTAGGGGADVLVEPTPCLQLSGTFHFGANIIYEMQMDLAFKKKKLGKATKCTSHPCAEACLGLH